MSNEFDLIHNQSVLISTALWDMSLSRAMLPQNTISSTCQTFVVNLTSPYREKWEWNDNQSTSSIRGSAVEFTQVRNIQDSSLVVIGHSADQWMTLAQCFAGAPITPPVKGSRYKV